MGVWIKAAVRYSWLRLLRFLKDQMELIIEPIHPRSICTIMKTTEVSLEALRRFETGQEGEIRKILKIKVYNRNKKKRERNSWSHMSESESESADLHPIRDKRGRRAKWLETVPGTIRGIIRKRKNEDGEMYYVMGYFGADKKMKQ